MKILKSIYHRTKTIIVEAYDQVGFAIETLIGIWTVKKKISKDINKIQLDLIKKKEELEKELDNNDIGKKTIPKI